MTVHLLEIAFFLCVGATLYVWVGYPVIALVLWRWRGLRRCFPLPEGFGEVRLSRRICSAGTLARLGNERAYEPRVSLIVAAYNEESWVEKKVRNCLELLYPREKLELIFVTDGSTDCTVELLGRVGGVQVYHEPERRGKIAAVNRVVPFATGEILVFSDANTMLNPEALRAIVRHFAHARVGCVAGEKRIVDSGASSSGKGEGLYWRYESALKRIDSRLWSVVGAAGELFAIRREVFSPVEEDALIEDFLMSVRVVLKGYRAVYEPAAVASECPSASVREEMRRRIRIGAGGLQSVLRLKPLWAFWRHGLFGFCYWSHRAFRWLVAPYAFFLSFPIALLAGRECGWFWAAAAAQGCVFAAAWWCWTLECAGRRVPGPLRLVYFFVMVHWAALVGALRYCLGWQKVTWDKARRAEPLGTKPLTSRGGCL